MRWKNILAVLWPVGVAKEQIVMSVAWAVVIGVFPVYGCPTLMCMGAALLLRLNLPAMQAVNLLTAPLQFALLVPFSNLGTHLVHVSAPQTLHGGARIASQVGGFLVHAVAGWCCIAIPLSILLYLAVRPLRERLALGLKERNTAHPA